MMKAFDRSKFIAFDVETSSDTDEAYALQPFRVRRHEAHITSYAIAYADATGKLVTRVRENPTREQMFNLLEWCNDTGKTLVAWNAAFDAAWLYAHGLEASLLASSWLDPMLLWMHLDRIPESELPRTKRRHYGLKLAVAQFLPQYAGYDEGVDFHSQTPAARRRRLKYNQMDAACTLLLAERFYNALAEEDPQWLRAALIEARCIPLIAESRVQGLMVNTGALDTLDEKLAEDSARSLAALEQFGATPEILSSPTQLGALLFDQWGLPILKHTAKGAPSTDKEVLHELALMDSRARTIRTYREASGNRAKFVTAIRNSVEYNGDGFTRPEPRIAGTYTGRLTFASKQGKGVNAVPVGFAVHQTKRGEEYRSSIEAPPGFTIIEWDAASQEFRWMAIESGDETMLSLCMPGEDAHSFMGAQIAHQDYREMQSLVADGDKMAKASRRLGKVGNLSCQYRTSAKKLRVVARVQYDLPMEMPEADHIHRTYHGTYRGVGKYWVRQIHKCMRLGYAETLAGRRVQLPNNWNDRAMRWALESTSINFPIQGVGADQKYLAIAALRPLLARFGGHFYFELHDGLYVIVPTRHAERVAVLGQQLLTALPYKRAWGLTPPVPLPWDIKIGPSWGTLKEFHP